jgi:hypothetical protein
MRLVNKVLQVPLATGRYGAMRELFNVDEIQSKYVVWMETGAEVRHADWLNIMAATILKQVSTMKVGMYAVPASFVVGDTREGMDRSTILKWYGDREWYTGKVLRGINKQPSTDQGEVFHYGQTGFCVFSTEAIKACGIPDFGAWDLGGDVVIGEQLWQNGFRTLPFNLGGSLVHFDPEAAEQRGKYPWQ